MRIKINIVKKRDDNNLYVYTGYLDNLKNEIITSSHSKRSHDLQSMTKEEILPGESKFIDCEVVNFREGENNLAVVKEENETPLRVQEGLVVLNKNVKVLVINQSSNTYVLDENIIVSTAETLKLGETICNTSECKAVTLGGVKSINLVQLEKDLLEGSNAQDEEEDQGLPLPSECPKLEYEEEIRKSKSFPESFKEDFLNFFKKYSSGIVFR